MRLEARLRAFAAFARVRSFSGAARELRISQPAVSKHIADIEHEFGAPLVERRQRRGALTPAGEFLANYVLRAEAILAQAALGVPEFRELGSGALRIVAAGVSGTYLLPEVIAQFQQAHPGIRVSLELATSARAVEALRSHRAELGMVSGFLAAPEIEIEPLLRNEIVVVGSRRLAARRLSRDQLESLTWISREEGSATRAAVEAAFADLGIAPKRRLELPSWEAIKLMVRRGYGVAACSRFVVEEEVLTGLLAVIPIRGWKVSNTMSVIRVRDAALTPAGQRFLIMLRTRAGQARLQGSFGHRRRR
jgi:LysR family transcriptional regulator, transcriptional activator of the cysJI operon